MGLVGTRECFPKGARWPRRVTVTVRFGVPFRIRKRRLDGRRIENQEAADSIMLAIADLLPENLRGDFLLRVKGESMIEAGILDGDIVVVRRAQDARNGDIVVALAGDDESTDEATVKTFYKEKGRIRLQPENSALEPIYADYVQVLGKVVGVFREL